MAGRRRWQDELSVDRLTPDQIEIQSLRQQRLEQQIAADPLQQQVRETQFSHAQAAEAKARYDLNKEIETDKQRTAFYNGLQELETNLNSSGAPIGTKKHAEAFAAYAHEFPLARSSSDVDQTLKLHAAVHDDQAALETRMHTAAAAARAQGQIPEGMDVTATGEVNLRTRPNTPEAQLQGYGFTPQQFLNPFKVERGTIGDKGFQGADTGNVVRITAGTDTKGQPLVRTMSVPEYNTFKNAFQPSSIPMTPAVAPNPGQAVTQAVPTVTTANAPVAGSASTGKPTANPEDQAAIAWAAANPNDPRAAKIRSLHGVEQ